MSNRLMFIIYRVIFIVAGLMVVLALWDRILRMFGLTLYWIPYEPARLIELSAYLVIFVIALLLRQIREIVKKKDMKS